MRDGDDIGKRAIEHERAPEKPISGKTSTKFVNQPISVAPSYFQDRYEENKIIGKFLRNEACRMMTVVGCTGIGKTAWEPSRLCFVSGAPD